MKRQPFSIFCEKSPLAEHATRKDDLTLYRAPVALRILFSISVVDMFYGATAVALSKEAARDWWVAILLLGMGVLSLVFIPGEIGVSNSGIDIKKWLGLYKRSFSWNEIASAMYYPDERSIGVVSNCGYVIKHTMYHIDRARFIRDMQAHGKWLDPTAGFNLTAPSTCRQTAASLLSVSPLST